MATQLRSHSDRRDRQLKTMQYPESTTYVGIRGLEEILATNRVLSEQIWLLMFEADAETGALRRIPP